MGSTRWRWLVIAVTAGCSSPARAPGLAPPIPAATDAAIAPVDAAVVAAVPDAAPPGTCAPTLTAMLPADPALVGAVFYRDGATVRSGKFGVCDTPDRVVLWADSKRTQTRDPQVAGLAGTLLVITRGQVDHVQRAPYAKGAHCVDDCAGGGHAGCSMTSGCTIGGAGLDGASLSLYAEQGYTLGKSEADVHGCGPQARGYAFGRVVGFCSTATHLAVLTTEDCSAGEVLALSVFDNPHDRDDEAFEPTPMHGDLDRGQPSGTRWSYAFPAFAGTRGAALTIDVGAAPSATLEVAGQREDCFVFALRPEM